jgi:two-component system response regulator HydG
MADGTAPPSSSLHLPSSSQRLSVKEAEKQLLIRALKETDGNRTLAAKRIGMSRRTLYRKLHAYQLETL